MLKNIDEISKSAFSELEAVSNKEQLENFRLKYLVKKGILQSIIDEFKDVSVEDKKLFGKPLNEFKKSLELAFQSKKEDIEAQSDDTPDIDLTLPGRRYNRGSMHPVRQTLDECIEIFRDLGFSVAEGPDIEDGYHNFDALNFPPNHPAREMQDTFFVKSENREIVLRTHTSPVQIRMMENKKPPIRSIMPGRVYRNESIDATHLAEFHQIEGLYIDTNVSMAELKATMITFAQKMYGDGLQFRFRPSFFPFTEPSAELDVSRDGVKWMEVAGCGMVHPNVLRSCGVDPEIYSGYAFGFGVERVTMLRTKLDDIRLLYENDVRVLKQF